MKKKKCYVLIVSSTFPKGNEYAGLPTKFPELILEKSKIHTIRENVDFWNKRFQKINNGEAYWSVRTWIGKPYRSKQIEIKRFDKNDGIGLEILNLYQILENENAPENDGLTKLRFFQWFKKVDSKKPLAVIHFSKLRYQKTA